jgi:hypothetical protein
MSGARISSGPSGMMLSEYGMAPCRAVGVLAPLSSSSSATLRAPRCLCPPGRLRSPSAALRLRMLIARPAVFGGSGGAACAGGGTPANANGRMPASRLARSPRLNWLVVRGCTGLACACACCGLGGGLGAVMGLRSSLVDDERRRKPRSEPRKDGHASGFCGPAATGADPADGVGGPPVPA